MPTVAEILAHTDKMAALEKQAEAVVNARAESRCHGLHGARRAAGALLDLLQRSLRLAPAVDCATGVDDDSNYFCLGFSHFSALRWGRGSGGNAPGVGVVRLGQFVRQWPGRAGTSPEVSGSSANAANRALADGVDRRKHQPWATKLVSLTIPRIDLCGQWRRAVEELPKLVGGDVDLAVQACQLIDGLLCFRCLLLDRRGDLGPLRLSKPNLQASERRIEPVKLARRCRLLSLDSVDCGVCSGNQRFSPTIGEHRQLGGCRSSLGPRGLQGLGDLGRRGRGAVRQQFLQHVHI